MSPGKLILYLVGALLVLVIASAVVSAVFALVSFTIWLLSVIIALAVLGGLGYGAYKLYGLLSGDSSSHGTGSTDYGLSGSTQYETDVDSLSSESSDSDIDSLKEQYAAGELSEAEFERQIEQALDTDSYDSIDRELQRERSR